MRGTRGSCARYNTPKSCSRSIRTGVHLIIIRTLGCLASPFSVGVLDGILKRLMNAESVKDVKLGDEMDDLFKDFHTLDMIRRGAV